MSHRAFQLLALLAQRRPLDQLSDVCEQQAQISSRRLREMVELAGDALAGYAVELRHEWDKRVSESPHLNSPDVLPPVGTPLIIQLRGGLARASRTGYLSRKDGQMQYQLEGGGQIEGRFPWTYA